MKISEIITNKYKLRIPPTVYYDLLADVQEVEESTTKNNLGVDCNNCKNNFHRGDGTSYCATGDGMCHYECEETILDKITEIIEPLRHLSIDEMSDIEWQILRVIDEYKTESER